jgi:histidine triad (HIT) family protein
MTYDPDNVFAKILRGELPCKKVYEDEFALAFHDIHPKAPVHVLVVPKGPYVELTDFARDAPVDLVSGFLRAVVLVAEQLGVEQSGYRALFNIGPDSGQEVPHLHVHLLAGRRFGALFG